MKREEAGVEWRGAKTEKQEQLLGEIAIGRRGKERMGGGALVFL